MSFINTPEHWHVIINHIPIWGLAFGLIPLFYGLLKREMVSLRWGLILVFVSTIFTPFIMETGESAEDRIEQHPAIVWDKASKDHLDIHEERAETTALFLYITCASSTISFFLSFFKRKATLLLALISSLLAITSLGLAGWTADAGGKIRHAEFRQ